MILYYEIMFFTSVILTVIYALIWNKRFNVHFTLIFFLMPLSELGYVMLAGSDSLSEALAAQKILYAGACFLILLIMLSIFSVCRIKLNRWFHTVVILLSPLIYIGALTMGRSKLFYTNVTFEKTGGVSVLHKDYGVLHHVFYGMLILYMFLSTAALIYTLRKKDISNKTIYLMFLPEMITFVCFFGGKIYSDTFELVPFGYVFAQVIYLIIIHRMCLYEIGDTAADALVQNGNTGFVSLDMKLNYLASNETAKRIFPVLNELCVDKPVSTFNDMKANFLEWVERFRNDENCAPALYRSGGNSYQVTVSYLCIGGRKYGYQFFITDDTKNQQYIALLDRYNSDLRREVSEKTAHVLGMHDKLIMSMAIMVESRDNSTGGHIRRTSDVVRILMDEIMKENELGLKESFCQRVIKAAPMHDLGKIAVDDAILRKPARFTDEEFMIMKTHAAEGARIVHNILDGTDDIEFHIIAENVAHYHHERWDGSGYPSGLKGEEIPLEARIMAVADVYDALVSKRVYKESMSFEEADRIIMEGMGRHFDNSLEKYYVSARPRLEEYYSSLE